MDEITELIRAQIKKRYKNIKNFSTITQIPYSTLTHLLSKGIGTTAFDTVIKIFSYLDLSVALNKELILFNERLMKLNVNLNRLDEQGIHTIETVTRLELERLEHAKIEGTTKHYGGRSFARKELPMKDATEVKKMIKSVKERQRES